MESSDFSPATNAGASDSGMSGSTSSSASSSTTGNEQSGGLADRARSALSGAGEKLGDVGSSVRDRASSAKDSLANALEAGADRLRARSGDGTMGAATDGGSVAIADDRMTQVTSKVAGGMEGAASWLRDVDMEGLKSSVETQVKEHPGRTLLIAVGLGYLLGKALRK
jgi:hypothetical protein